MRKLKVAIIQYNPQSYQLEQNLEQAIDLGKKALSNGAKLIVLPELFDSGLTSLTWCIMSGLCCVCDDYPSR